MGMLTSFVDPYIQNELKVLADRNPRRIHEFYSDYLLYTREIGLLTAVPYIVLKCFFII